MIVKTTIHLDALSCWKAQPVKGKFVKLELPAFLVRLQSDGQGTQSSFQHSWLCAKSRHTFYFPEQHGGFCISGLLRTTSGERGFTCPKWTRLVSCAKEASAVKFSLFFPCVCMVVICILTGANFDFSPIKTQNLTLSDTLKKKKERKKKHFLLLKHVLLNPFLQHEWTLIRYCS